MEGRLANAEAEKAALEVLQRHWGFESFRDGQREAVEAILQGHNVLAVLPTGGGKSGCYQIPAVVLGGVTIVVSPLIALMEDQVGALRAKKIPAAALHSNLTYAETESIWAGAEGGHYRLLYLSPERLQTDVFRARLGRLPLKLLAIDEAHCISEWGHEFRPAYRAIAETRDLLPPSVPIIALTATATPEVRADIVAQLSLDEPAKAVQIVSGFDRPEIVWSVFEADNKVAKVAEIVNAVPGSGLVYAGTRNGAEQWASELTRYNVKAEAYHAGLDKARRSAVQKRWLAGETRVVAATSAFGMGIDRSDVRFVVHVELPPTLESYYQESGRCGRDGRTAYATLIHAAGDESLPQALIQDQHPDPKVASKIYETICSHGKVAIGSQPEEPIVVDRTQVVDSARVTPGQVEAVVQLVARAGHWRVVPLGPSQALLRVLVSPARLRTFAKRAGEGVSQFVDGLLRLVPSDAYTAWTVVDVRVLARRLNLTPKRTEKGLAYLAGQQQIKVMLSSDSALRLEFLKPRTKRPPIDTHLLREGRRRAESRLADVLAYRDSSTCRRHVLLNYFGEASAEACGRCDNCLGRHTPPVITPSDEDHLVAMLRCAQSEADPGKWPLFQGLTRSRFAEMKRYLVAEGLITSNGVRGRKYELTPRGRRLLASKS